MNAEMVHMQDIHSSPESLKIFIINFPKVKKPQYAKKNDLHVYHTGRDKYSPCAANQL